MRAAAIYPQEENAWVCLVSMDKYLMGKKGRRQSQWAQTEIQNIPFTLKKNSSSGSMIKHCNRLPRMALEPLSFETQNPSGCGPEQPALVDSVLIRSWTGGMP